MTAQPRYVARAIADAIAPEVRKAYRYLDEWKTLTEWTRMPIEHVRAVMDEPAYSSKARDAVNAWEGRGAFYLVGANGNGKTFAAALWALELARRGMSCCWVNASSWAQHDLDDQAALIRRASQAGGLIVDDAGAGVTEGDWFHRQIEGLLLDRAAKPSIVCGNMNTKQALAWMNTRLESRMKQHGGLVHVVAQDLRRPPPCDYDDLGRGPRWHDARALVDALGVRSASSWNETTRVDEQRLDVGHVLEQDTEARRRRARITTAVSRRAAADDAVRAKIDADERTMTLEGCREMTRAHDLDGAKILAAAVELEASDPATVGMERFAAATAKIGMVSESARRRHDTEARVLACYGTLAEQRDRLRSEADVSTIPTGAPPEWTKGAEGFKDMQRLGFEARHLGGDRGVEIIRKVKGRTDLMVIPEHDTAGQAWESLRRLLAVPVPPARSARGFPTLEGRPGGTA